MLDVYITKIDQKCGQCGHRNKDTHITDEKIEIIACGYCGAFILLPSNMDPDDERLISETISKVIDGDDNDIL